MNYQVFGKHCLIDWLIEVANKKGGMIISEEELFDIIHSKHLLNKISENISKQVTVNEIECEEFHNEILKRLGTISLNSDPWLCFGVLYDKYPKMDNRQKEILSKCVKYITEEVNNKKCKVLKFDDYIENMIESYGIECLEYVIDVVHTFTEYYESSSNSPQSKYNESHSISLKDLYQKESNNSEFGDFFDQRYIDFLSVNYDELPKMHWRKFEELTAQFFKNDGYEVKIGPGRKDGGVDVIATKGESAIIIQCKKWKKTVGVGTVKELHDDMTYKRIDKGVVATIEGLSSDSQKLINERKYNIDVIDRNYIIEKIKQYKSTI